MKHILQFSADNEDVICVGRAMCQYPGARCLPISNLSVFKLASDTGSVSTATADAGTLGELASVAGDGWKLNKANL